ncbi:MAG: type VI secretion system membrane subunit TssM, partial [Pyrinomonadaceae bacterium]
VPKSGKTSLVLSSGLNFQNLPSQRQSEQKSIRPTRNVDWRVTSDAVFLDTAGRYQTEGADGDEWASLLDTIKKYRALRPLDGMILTVSAEKILNSSEAEIEQMAKVLRARVDETIQRTKVRFPIYLIFTHADAIEGFRDSFSVSQREGQNLVWGATIPLEQTPNAHSLFDGEYDLLQNSVMKRRLMRLSAPFAPVRQLKIFNFPLHFGTGRRKLGAFVSTLFRPNPFSESPFLRGFYFTAVPVNRAAASGRGQTQIGQQTVGQSYFAEKLFRDVVLRDKDLVATFQSQKARPPILGWLLTLLGAGLVALLLLLAAVSLYQNKQMVDEATTRGEAVLTMVKADAGRNPLDKKPDEARAEIDTTDNLRKTLVDLDDYDRNGAPLSMRMGFYSGNRLFHEKLLPTYFNAVEQRFKKPTVKKLEDDLRKFAAAPAANLSQLDQKDKEKAEADLGKNYDLLKAYLMLSGDYKDKAEATSLSTTLAPYWKTESKIPGGSELVAQQQLEFYAKQVNRDEFPRIKLDAGLVDAVRKKLQAFPPVFRYYKRKITEISKDVDSKVGAKTVETVLAKNGGDTSYIEGGYQVPGAFTIEGYPLMKKAISDADKELSADDWVMGEQGKGTVAQTTDASTLENQYYRDYIENWKSYIKAINVKKYTKENAAKSIQAFSSANSPMEILLNDIARNVNLSAKPKTNGWWDWIKSFFVKTNANAAGEKTPVEGEFHALLSFMGEEGKSDAAPIGKYRNELGKVFNRLNGLSPDQLNQISKDLAAEKDTKLQLQQAETNVTNLLGGFDDTPSGQATAELLREPLGNLRTLLGVGVRDQLIKAWTDTILPKAKEIEKGFPFDASASEADITKLTVFLNPSDGTLSKFYADNLSKYFEEANGQIKVKEGSPAQFTDEFVAYLNNAFRLRKALFGEKNAAPSFAYEFKLMKTGDAVAEVTIDGQPKVDSSSGGTGSANLKFPASSGDTGVVMSLGASTSEPTSAVPSANSANSNVNTGVTSSAGSSQSAGGANALTFPGTWGLFKFFDAGAPKKQAGGEYLLTYKPGGKIVTATIKPTGDVDLFDRSVFTSVKVPQTFLK